MPQGCIRYLLGPLLFLLLVNYFSSLDEALLCADGTPLIMGGTTVGEIIGAALVCVLSWTGGCLNWQHQMNDVVKGCVLFEETPVKSD